MFVIRPLSIIEDGIERLEVSRIRIEPSVDMLGLDRDDAAIVAGSGDLGRRLVGDRCEA